MRIPLNLHCSVCREAKLIELDAAEPSLDFTCACGHRNAGFLDPRQPIAERLLRRSLRELELHGDMSMVIVLAAAAFEAELWRVHHRLERNAVEESAAGSGWHEPGSLTRLTELAATADPRGLDHLVEAHPDLRIAVDALGPVARGGAFLDGLSLVLLGPRDRILRWGEVRHGEDEARHAFSWAALGFRLVGILEGEHRSAVRRPR